MDDTAPPWLDGPDPAGRPAPRRRLRLLAIAAVVPWAVLLVALLRGGGAPGPPATHPVHDRSAEPLASDDADTAAERQADPDDRAGGAPGHGPSEGSPGPGDVVPPSGAGAGTTGTPPPTPPTVTDGDAATVAIAVARAWLSDEGAPDLDGPEVRPLRDGYLEHASVRRIEVVAADAAVVTVGVLLLERAGDRYAAVRAADVIVPLTLTAHAAHPAGPPWWSPHHTDLRTLPPATTPFDDPAVTHRVTRALLDAGYRQVEVRGTATTDGGLLVADVAARTATGAPLDGPVWLRDGPTHASLLGLLPSPDGPDLAEAPADPEPGSAATDAGPGGGDERPDPQPDPQEERP